MTTIKCNCGMCSESECGHLWCQRFQEFTEPNIVNLCRVHPIAQEELIMREVECPQTELEPVPRDAKVAALMKFLNIKPTENE